MLRVAGCELLIENNLNPYPETRNPQRAAFILEPLTEVIQAEPFGLEYLRSVQIRFISYEKHPYQHQFPYLKGLEGNQVSSL